MRSVLAVLAGFAAMAAVVIVATVLAAGMLAEPSRESGPAVATPAWLAVNALYSLAAAFLGGWLTARLAPRAPFAHVVALAALAVAMALPAVVRGASPGQPAWYPAGMTAIAIAGILTGGVLRRWREAARA